MKQTLKYGLVSPMRPFEMPESWSGTQHVTIIGATIHNGVVQITKDTTDVLITRNIEGNVKGNLRINIAQGANVKIVEEILGSGSYEGVVEVIAERCTATYHLLQNMTNNSLCILRYEAIADNGTFEWHSCFIGADTTIASLSTRAGEHVNSKNNAVIAGGNSQQFDIHVQTHHEGNNSKSDMLTRSVLDDKSRATYHGLIRINENANNCDSYQKDEVILLSSNAGADAIPDLEIHNNNVRCTHGASIGKLDEEKLFYLKSRGINETDAKRTITEGFLEPLTLPAWHRLIIKKISRS